jgi:hypothetical protein
VVGAVFAFGAPALALLGVILGGLDLSAAKREGKPRDLPLVGTVLAALGFFPALITALTCGVCNALVSSGPIHVQRDFRFGTSPSLASDAGVGPGWPVPAAGAQGAAPSEPPASPVPALPGDLPPPPLPAGPGPAQR